MENEIFCSFYSHSTGFPWRIYTANVVDYPMFKSISSFLAIQLLEAV